MAARRFSTKITRLFLERKRRKRITYNYERSDQTPLSMSGFVNIITTRNIKSFHVFFLCLRQRILAGKFFPTSVSIVELWTLWNVFLKRYSTKVFASNWTVHVFTRNYAGPKLLAANLLSHFKKWYSNWMFCSSDFTPNPGVFRRYICTTHERQMD